MIYIRLKEQKRIKNSFSFSFVLSKAASTSLKDDCSPRKFEIKRADGDKAGWKDGYDMFRIPKCLVSLVACQFWKKGKSP